VAQRVGRGTALLFHDHGNRRGWVVSSTPRPYCTPGKDPVPNQVFHWLIISLLKTFSMLWTLYSFLWVIPRRLNIMCRRFGTLFHLHTSSFSPALWRWNRQCSETSAHKIQTAGNHPKEEIRLIICHFGFYKVLEQEVTSHKFGNVQEAARF
jgi:hypothetical protein